MLAETYMKNIEYERKIGKAEGRTLGRLEGIREKEKKISQKMHNMGFAKEKIAEALCIPIKKVEEYIS